MKFKCVFLHFSTSMRTQVKKFCLSQHLLSGCYVTGAFDILQRGGAYDFELNTNKKWLCIEHFLYNKHNNVVKTCKRSRKENKCWPLVFNKWQCHAEAKQIKLGFDRVHGHDSSHSDQQQVRPSVAKIKTEGAHELPSSSPNWLLGLSLEVNSV